MSQLEAELKAVQGALAAEKMLAAQALEAEKRRAQVP